MLYKKSHTQKNTWRSTALHFPSTFFARVKASIGILLPKLFWPIVRKNCPSDQEKLLRFEAEGREIAKKMRSQYYYLFKQ